MDDLRTVLVLGCSHGLGTYRLSQLGFQAWGIDVAKTAIEMAKQLRGRTCGDAPGDCFIKDNILQIPFPDRSFDAGLSTEVLEHIRPADIPKVVSEISRVVRSFLFVQMPQEGQHHYNGGHGRDYFAFDLQPTLKSPAWWKDQFTKFGWTLLEDLSNESTTMLVLVKPSPESLFVY
eukprot:gnl/TRDRNA2_/TRDRNA2_132440_c0_seq1.p1 gnl/TRDRNA2_/TRDRNA2_132440_c0~~gnl/TRDRNA2_/TRDRNA2_132440_c0_seq1.p1  ORF type:complete len:176 (-),score=7.75 gnl/TRDRNA2_/TRDRNA2_132440_c0_seq1:178-705(-)